MKYTELWVRGDSKRCFDCSFILHLTARRRSSSIFQISQLLPTWSGYILPYIPYTCFLFVFLRFFVVFIDFLGFWTAPYFSWVFFCSLFRQPPFFLCFSCFLSFLLVAQFPFTLCATFWYSNTPPNLRKKWISECSSPPVDIPSILYHRVLQRPHLDSSLDVYFRQELVHSPCNLFNLFVIQQI